MLWKGLFQLDVWGVKQDLILYVGQQVLSNILFERWIIDPDIHGLFDGPCNVVRYPTQNGEIVHLCMMTCVVFAWS